MDTPWNGSDDRRSQERPDNDETHHQDAVFTFARACELHDQDTGDHLVRMRCIVTTIAKSLGVAPTEARTLGYNAMLHDVGKLRVPAELLQKDGPLTDDERTVVEAHTVDGEQLLIGRPSMECAAVIARQHHEAWDGSGYPDGRTGNDIALDARITTAADILDALLAPRAYKSAWPYEEALDYVIGLSGSKLDPDVVAAMQRAEAERTLRPATQACVST